MDRSQLVAELRAEGPALAAMHLSDGRPDRLARCTACHQRWPCDDSQNAALMISAAAALDPDGDLYLFDVALRDGTSLSRWVRGPDLDTAIDAFAAEVQPRDQRPFKVAGVAVRQAPLLGPAETAPADRIEVDPAALRRAFAAHSGLS